MAKLEIPAHARVVRQILVENIEALFRQEILTQSINLRCDQALVVEIFGQPTESTCFSWMSRGFIYQTGEQVVPEKDFDSDVLHPDGSGIHFFEKLEDAQAYKFVSE